MLSAVTHSAFHRPLAARAMEDDLRSFLASYQEHLGDLKQPTKASIAALTMLAAEQANNPAAASALAAAVENHIITCSPAYRLPALYLMDSIVKNCPGVFKPLFTRNLPQMFFATWDQGTDRTRSSLERVLDTWVAVFDPVVLDIIRSRLAPQAFVPQANVQRPLQYPIQQGMNSHVPQQYMQYGGGQPVPMHINTMQTAGIQHAIPAQARAVQQPAQQPMQPMQSYQHPHPVVRQPAPSVQPPGSDVSQQMLHLLEGLRHAVPTPPPNRASTPATTEPKFAPGSLEAARLKAKDDTVLQQLLEKSKLARAKNLDRLFLHRQRMRQAVDSSRHWFVTTDVWLLGASANIAADFTNGQHDDGGNIVAAVEYSTPVDPAHPCCAITGERFQEVWDVKSQEWHYKGAKRVTDEEAIRFGIAPGSIVLASCLGSTPLLADKPASPLRDGKAAVKRLRQATPPVEDADVAAKRVKTEN